MTEKSPHRSVAERNDAICDQFEKDFRAGRKPVLETLLLKATSAVRPALFRALLELEVELRQKAGETPKVTDYESRFPDHHQTIHATFEALRHQPSNVSSVNATGIDTSRGPVVRAKTANTSGQPTAPRSLGRFEIKSVLGEGAFGTVYRARDPQLDRDVAVKVPKFAGQQSLEDRARFLREARAAAGLHHAQICPVHEIGTIDGVDYIVLAFIDGKPLSGILQTKPKLSNRQIVTVIRKLALALQEAHDKGIIHRDLKPANIMINRKGEPVIMDFGLARRSHSTDVQISHSGQIMGTPAYMSPEQARGDGKAVGLATDIYSLGIVLYEMICGRRPFEGTVTEVIGKILHVAAPPPAKFRPDVDERLQAICLKAIAKKPVDRFASMKEFATALADYARALPSADRPTSAPVIETGKEATTNQFAELLAAISSDVESKVERAVRRVERPHRLPWWSYLAGSALMGLIVLLGILFFIRKDTVTVIVSIPIENINDPALSFILDNNPIAAAAFAVPIELKPGQHELVVNKDGQLFKRFVFDVGAKQTDPVVVQDVTPNRAGPYIELVRELQTPADETDCWLTPDGLTIYFLREGPETATPGIFRATRTDAGTPFGLPQFVSAGRHVTLSADEKCLVVLEGGGESQPILQASRASTNTPFGEFAPVLSLQGDQSKKSPSLSRDGRTLIYQRSDETKTYPGQTVNGVHSEFCVIRRSTVTEAWSAPQRLPMLADPTLTHVVWPMLSDDELLLFFGNGGTRWDTELMYAVRTSTQEPFGIARRITVDGKQVYGRSPRYIAATNELYFSWDHGTKAAPADVGIYVVKNFVPVLPTQESNGFVSLFNGKDLTGWKTHQLLPGGWTVENGLLTGRTNDFAHLFTERGDYHDFHLRAECRTNRFGNSGIFFRTPFALDRNNVYPSGYEAQIIHEFPRDSVNLTGSLLVSRDGHQPLHKEQRKLVNHDEWFTIEVIARGPQLTVMINGQVIVHAADDSFSRGHISLQCLKDQQTKAADPTTVVQFRDILIKELKPPDDGWIDLFNGKDLTGWKVQLNDGKQPPTPWAFDADRKVVMGRSLGQPGGGHSWLETVQTFGDFELSLEWRFPPGASVGVNGSGVVILANGLNGINFDPKGVEIDLRKTRNQELGIGNGCFLTYDTVVQAGQKSTPAFGNGNIDTLKEPTVHLEEQWNSTLISCRQGRIQVSLNSELVNEATTTVKSGKVCLRNQNTDIEFREVRIRPLNAQADGWTELFNGKDLTGWKTDSDQPGGWTVEDSLLTGRSMLVNHLISEASGYVDFHLRAECRTNRFGNGGINFRSDGTLRHAGPDKPLYARGYEAQILHEYSAATGMRTGGIHSSSGNHLAPVDKCNIGPNEWFTMDIIAQNDQLIVKVNGQETANVRNSEFKGGHVVFQVMRDAVTPTESLIQFRNIRIKSLQESDDLARWQGRWRLVAMSGPGGDFTEDKLAGLNQSMRIEGNRRFVERTINGQPLPYSGTFRINPDASSKAFDFDFDGTAAAGGQRGLYEFDGPKLRLIYRASNTEKPQRAQWTDKGQNAGWFEYERSDSTR